MGARAELKVEVGAFVLIVALGAAGAVAASFMGYSEALAVGAMISLGAVGGTVAGTFLASMVVRSKEGLRGAAALGGFAAIWVGQTIMMVLHGESAGWRPGDTGFVLRVAVGSLLTGWLAAAVASRMHVPEWEDPHRSTRSETPESAEEVPPPAVNERKLRRVDAHVVALPAVAPLASRGRRVDDLARQAEEEREAAAAREAAAQAAREREAARDRQREAEAERRAADEAHREALLRRARERMVMGEITKEDYDQIVKRIRE